MGGPGSAGSGFSSKASGMMVAPPGLSKSAAPSIPAADGSAFVSKSKSMSMMDQSAAVSKAKTSAFAFQAPPLVPAGLPTPAGVPLPDEKEYVVENTRLQAASEGMAYRSSKNWEDRADAQVNWGETVKGRDEGDGWLKVRHPSGILFLPFKAQGKLVVFQREAPAAVAKSKGGPPTQAPGLPSKYRVDNSKLMASSEGLQFRGSKRWEDRADAQVQWGETVMGVDEGDGWLKVGNLYLPFIANNCPVLVLDAQDPLAGFYAARN